MTWRDFTSARLLFDEGPLKVQVQQMQGDEAGIAMLLANRLRIGSISVWVNVRLLREYRRYTER